MNNAARPTTPATAMPTSCLLAAPDEVADAEAPVALAPSLPDAVPLGVSVATMLENTTVLEPSTTTPLVMALTASLEMVACAPPIVRVREPRMTSSSVLPPVVTIVSMAVRTTLGPSVIRAPEPEIVRAWLSVLRVELACGAPVALASGATPGHFKMQDFMVLYAVGSERSFGYEACAHCLAQSYAEHGRSSAFQKGAPSRCCSYSVGTPVPPVKLNMLLYCGPALAVRSLKARE